MDALPSGAGAVAFLRIDNARFDGDDGEGLKQEIWQSLTREWPRLSNDLLALSGGQEDGAFGAGLLVGWSERGDRPRFKIVTGTSTGALAAPFAFLGREYDWALKKIYTETQAADVVSGKRFLLSAVNNEALMDSGPLEQSIAKYLDIKILDRIGEEYEKGRLLLISTTNLDTGRLAIWNVGAIAASGHPRRLDLVRKIILASAAIPGMFPPVMIDVLLDQAKHQEMHVDGGTVSQVFLYPPSLKLGGHPAAGEFRPSGRLRHPQRPRIACAGEGRAQDPGDRRQGHRDDDRQQRRGRPVSHLHDDATRPHRFQSRADRRRLQATPGRAVRSASTWASSSSTGAPRVARVTPGRRCPPDWQTDRTGFSRRRACAS